MWKKLVLLATVASAVSQLVRHWQQSNAKALSKGVGRTDLQRWEDEGGNLPPRSEAMRADTVAAKRAAAAGSGAPASAPF